jgi:hypothetical protein
VSTPGNSGARPELRAGPIRHHDVHDGPTVRPEVGAQESAQHTCLRRTVGPPFPTVDGIGRRRITRVDHVMIRVTSPGPPLRRAKQRQRADRPACAVRHRLRTLSVGSAYPTISRTRLWSSGTRPLAGGEADNIDPSSPIRVNWRMSRRLPSR